MNTTKDYTIVRQNEDRYSTWDVDSKGYVRNEQPKMAQEVFNSIVEDFKTSYPLIWDTLDYFNCDIIGIFPAYHWLSIFYVTGGSEGYYFHIEAIQGKERKLLFLGKTLYEDIDTALEIQNALCRILQP